MELTINEYQFGAKEKVVARKIIDILIKEVFSKFLN